MFGLGMPEILLILAIALMVIGPKKLPDLAKTLGRALGEFKKAAHEFKNSIDMESTVKEFNEPLKNVKDDLKVFSDPLNQSIDKVNKLSDQSEQPSVPAKELSDTMNQPPETALQGISGQEPKIDSIKVEAKSQNNDSEANAGTNLPDAQNIVKNPNVQNVDVHNKGEKAK